MTKEDPYRVQADMQKKRIPRVDKTIKLKEEKEETTSEGIKYPPRRSVHHKKRKKKKFKTPLITLLVIIFILLPISVLFINKALSERGFSSIIPADSSSKQFEQVDIQQNNDSEEISADDKKEQTSEQEEKKNEEKPTEVPANETVNKNANEEKKEQIEKQTDQGESKTVQTEQKTPVYNSTTDAKNIKKVQGTKDDSGAFSENMKDEETSTNNKTTTSPVPNETTEGKVVYHKVAKGETLYRIAMNYYHSDDGIEKIRAANNLQGNEIQLGQTLKIPLP
ncbi:LysM peptidoglycan-binding domain-containing protein [Niallia sp. 03133]|uniref:LysM peptidoglycan-binding domain-containing protein n=1 Tax=Niallia sp. 03133 TaxID=3458060 RepID=UPI00404503F5